MSKKYMDNKIPLFFIVESSVWFDERLTKTDAALYGIICSLANNQSYQCYATNEYLCYIARIQLRQLQYSLKKLAKCDYIIISTIKNKRFIKPTINKFVEYRNGHKDVFQKIELFHYDWLAESLANESNFKE